MLISNYFYNNAVVSNLFISYPLNFLNEEILWSNFYLFYLLMFIYILFILVILIYTFNHNSYTYISKEKYTSLVWYVNGNFLSKIIFFFFTNILLLSYIIYGPVATIWYSHLLVDSVCFKMNFLTIFFFLFIVTLLNVNIIYIYNNTYDFLLIIVNLFFWINLLFFSNNLFTIIFFFEILTITIMLLNSLSIFFYNLSFKKINFFNNLFFFLNLPYYQISSLIYFFWISFIASVNLFIYLLFFIYYFNTIDLFFLEFVVNFLKNFFNLYDLFTYFFIWFGFLFCIFLKCGLVPFFIWKPNFFKGISYIYLYIYSTFYYFFLLIFLIFFFTFYFNELLNLFIYINLIILILGLFMILSLLFNLTYVKAFFALSSILNTLLVFITLISFNYYSNVFLL